MSSLPFSFFFFAKFLLKPCSAFIIIIIIFKNKNHHDYSSVLTRSNPASTAPGIIIYNYFILETSAGSNVIDDQIDCTVVSHPVVVMI